MKFAKLKLGAIPQDIRQSINYYSTRPAVGCFKRARGEDDVIDKYSQYFSCREGLLSTIAWHLALKTKQKNPNGTPVTLTSDMNKIDLNKTRLLFAYGFHRTKKGHDYVLEKKSPANVKLIKELDARMTEAVRYVNLIEKALRFPLTKLYKVTNKIDTIIYAVEGTRRWQRAPHVLSLYILMLRTFGIRKTLTGAKTYEDVLKQARQANGDGDSGYLQAYSVDDKLKVFLENFSELYKGATTAMCFNGSRFGGASKVRHDGIQYLMSGKSVDTKTKKKFTLIRKRIKDAKSKARKAT